MQKIWYSFVKFSVRLAIKLFYRRIEIHGQDTYPSSGPVLLAPNHQNAFMDALIPAVFAPRPIHFLVRADVFKSKFAAWFFRSLNMMPVYRQRDGVGNLSKNEAVFEQCFEILRNNGTLLIFPEASHLGERMLRPLSKGFARILFGALEDHDHLHIQVVPVGLNYSNYQDSQSRLIVNWGKPIPVSNYYESYQSNPAKAMSSLRDDLQTALSVEIVNIQTDWGRRAIDIELERVIPFFLHRTTGYEEPLGEMGFYKARESVIDRMQEDDVFFRRINIYDTEMDRLKLRAPFFFIERKDAGYWVIQNLLLIVFLPIFLLSWLLHAPTYFTIRGALKKFVSDKQFHSSIKLVGTIVLFPIFGLVIVVLASIWTGRPLFSALAIAGFYPVSIFVIRELRLPYRYTLTKWRMLWLRWRKKDLCKYLRSIENDILEDYRRCAR
jgi:1-acyl-sn-glycerol-3-phosphate acyltransferase